MIGRTDDVIGVFRRQDDVEGPNQPAAGQSASAASTLRASATPSPLLGGLEDEVGMVVMRPALGIDIRRADRRQPSPPGLEAVVVQERVVV